MLTYRGSQVDAAEDSEVEDGGAVASLVDKPDVGNRSWDQGLHRGHAESLDGAGSGQRPEALRLGSPEAGDHETDGRGDIYWTPADLDGEGVAE